MKGREGEVGRGRKEGAWKRYGEGERSWIRKRYEDSVIKYTIWLDQIGGVRDVSCKKLR